MEIEGDASGSSGTLVLFPGALGDAVCAEPAVAWLANLGPVTFHARGGAAEVAALFPSRPTLASLDSAAVARLFAPLGGEAPPPEAWLGRFDRVMSFTGASSPELCARMAKVPNTRVIPFPGRSGRGHVVDEMLAAVSQGVAVAGAVPILRLDEGEGAPAGRPLLAIHPGSGGVAKRVRREHFREVARRWVAEVEGSVSVVLGPAEAPEAEWWEAEVGPVERPRSVTALARGLVTASIYLGNDSGPSHVAAALGVSTVVLFRATDPGRFGPRGPHVRSVPSAGGPGGVERAWEAVAAALP